MIGCFILGFLIERFFLRPLIGEKLIFVIMLTVGLAAMFKGFILSSGAAICTPIRNSCRHPWRCSSVPFMSRRPICDADYQRCFSGIVRTVF
jgi:branched-subunit amino acid ABC-type transport system permease component